MTYEVLADHSLLLALPAFAPAIVVVGVVVWIAMKDRRNAEDDDAADHGQPHGDRSVVPDEDRSP